MRSWGKKSEPNTGKIFRKPKRLFEKRLDSEMKIIGEYSVAAARTLLTLDEQSG